MPNALSQVPRYKSFSVYDAVDPDSVYNLLPDCKLKSMLDMVPEELRDINEKQLFQLVEPSENVQLLRHAFWAEVRMAHDAKRLIRVENTHAGIMTRTAYAKNLTPANVAYILCPTQEYSIKLEHAHELALKGVVEILARKPTGDKGMDYNYARLQLEIFKFLNDKKYGGTVQKQFNINHNTTVKENKNVNASVDELKKQLQGDIIEI